MSGKFRPSVLAVAEALLAFASYFARFGSSAASGVRYSSDAGMSYQAPSAKSTIALPDQFTVTTRPTLPSKRFNSGLSAFTITRRSVQVLSESFGKFEIGGRHDWLT